MTGAATIARGLNAKRCGSTWVAKCPAHDDRSPSFSISEGEKGRVLVHCHTGCTQAEVIAALQRRGLWDGVAAPERERPACAPVPIEERSNHRAARDIWDNARPAKGTVVEEYLRSRGIRLMSEQLRYTPHLKHGPTKQTFRAMIARIADDRGTLAIQRTYLDRERAKKADVAPAKMTLGNMLNGAVRLRECRGELLGLAEGVETALSAMQLYSMPVWATLSANRLDKIELPTGVTTLTIFADPGEVGWAAAERAADYYERERKVHTEIVLPAAHFQVTEKADFNDVLRGRVA